MNYSHTTKYERNIVNATKQFANNNNISFSKMTELIIVNTIRTVRSYEKDKIDEILQSIKDMRSNAKKHHKNNNDNNYYEGEFIAAEAMILKIKEIAGITRRNKPI